MMVKEQSLAHFESILRGFLNSNISFGNVGAVSEDGMQCAGFAWNGIISQKYDEALEAYVNSDEGNVVDPNSIQQVRQYKQEVSNMVTNFLTFTSNPTAFPQKDRQMFTELTPYLFKYFGHMSVDEINRMSEAEFANRYNKFYKEIQFRLELDSLLHSYAANDPEFQKYQQDLVEVEVNIPTGNNNQFTPQPQGGPTPPPVQPTNPQNPVQQTPVAPISPTPTPVQPQVNPANPAQPQTTKVKLKPAFRFVNTEIGQGLAKYWKGIWDAWHYNKPVDKYYDPNTGRVQPILDANGNRVKTIISGSPIMKSLYGGPSPSYIKSLALAELAKTLEDISESVNTGNPVPQNPLTTTNPQNVRRFTPSGPVPPGAVPPVNPVGPVPPVAQDENYKESVKQLTPEEQRRQNVRDMNNQIKKEGLEEKIADGQIDPYNPEELSDADYELVYGAPRQQVSTKIKPEREEIQLDDSPTEYPIYDLTDKELQDLKGKDLFNGLVDEAIKNNKDEWKKFRKENKSKYETPEELREAFYRTPDMQKTFRTQERVAKKLEESKSSDAKPLIITADDSQLLTETKGMGIDGQKEIERHGKKVSTTTVHPKKSKPLELGGHEFERQGTVVTGFTPVTKDGKPFLNVDGKPLYRPIERAYYVDPKNPNLIILGNEVVKDGIPKTESEVKAYNRQGFTFNVGKKKQVKTVDNVNGAPNLNPIDIMTVDDLIFNETPSQLTSVGSLEDIQTEIYDRTRALQEDLAKAKEASPKNHESIKRLEEKLKKDTISTSRVSRLTSDAQQYIPKRASEQVEEEAANEKSQKEVYDLYDYLHYNLGIREDGLKRKEEPKKDDVPQLDDEDKAIEDLLNNIPDDFGFNVSETETAEPKKKSLSDRLKGLTSKAKELVDDIVTDARLKAQNKKDARADRRHELNEQRELDREYKEALKAHREEVKKEKAIESAAKKAGKIVARQEKRAERKEKFQAKIKKVGEALKKASEATKSWLQTKFGKPEMTNDSVKDGVPTPEKETSIEDIINDSMPPKPQYESIPTGMADMAADCMWKSVADELKYVNDLDKQTEALLHIAKNGEMGKEATKGMSDEDFKRATTEKLGTMYENYALDYPERIQSELKAMGVDLSKVSQMQLSDPKFMAKQYANAKLQATTGMELTSKGLARVALSVMADPDYNRGDAKNGGVVEEVTYGGDSGLKQTKTKKVYRNNENPLYKAMQSKGLSLDVQPFVDAVEDQINQTWPAKEVTEILKAGGEGISHPTAKQKTMVDDNGNPIKTAVFNFNGIEAYLSLDEKTPNGQMKLIETSPLTPVGAMQNAQSFGQIQVTKVIESAKAQMQLAKELGNDPAKLAQLKSASVIYKNDGGMGL